MTKSLLPIKSTVPGTSVEWPDFDPEVTPDMYPHFGRWRDLVEAGVIIAGSSDWPWSTLEEGFGSPMLLLYQAVTRSGTNRRPPEAWMLDQAITLEQALRSLTINGAYATFEEDKKGSLEPGKLADLVILSDNPLTAPIEAVPDIQVLLTMIGGKIEFCVVGQQSLCPGVQTTKPLPSPVLPFTGTWEGTDPSDGSIITLSLTQMVDVLTGTFMDSFSAAVNPPGYEGSGVGAILSATTAQITFNLTRWDGKSAQSQFSPTLSNQNNTLTLACDGGCPIVLQRK